MSEPLDPPRGSDPEERHLRRSWWLFAGCVVVLTAVVVGRIVADGAGPLDLAIVALIGAVAVAAIIHRRMLLRLATGRRAEAEGVARILQGLSRSVSPDAIVEAIVADLGIATGADHVVVVRGRPEARTLEATLVSSRPGVPSSTTLFPRSDLDGAPETEPSQPAAMAVPMAVPEPTAVVGEPGTGAPPMAPPTRPFRTGEDRPAPTDRPAIPARAAATGPAARVRAELGRLLPARAGRASADGAAYAGVVGGSAGRTAERLAARARDVFGLRNTLAAPLEGEDGVVGAIVLARRIPDPWPPVARRLLTSAAVEASAALSRATNHRAAEARATTDALTGLPNRRYFDEFCGLLARRRRADDAVGVLLIDIDHFKRVNDEHGHPVGDEVLRAVARAIAGTVREQDVPARFGGEEFAVLLRNPGHGIAVEVAERIRAAVGRLDLRELGPTGVTVSVGVAVSAVDDQPIRELIEGADRALYEAKRGGRDRVVAAA